MRRSLLLVPLLLALVAAPAAYGGGFATVGLSSTPAGLRPGSRGRSTSPCSRTGGRRSTGCRPTVRIRSGDTVKEFPTRDRQARRLPRERRVPGDRASGATRSSTATSSRSTRSRPSRSPATPGAPRRSAPAPTRGRRHRDRLAVGRRRGARCSRWRCSRFDRRRRHPARSDARAGVRPAPLIAGALVVAAAAHGRRRVHGRRRRASRRSGPPRRRSRRRVAAQRRARACGWSRAAAPATRSPPANATGTLGPDLALSLHGMPAAYIKESIVAPVARRRRPATTPG